MEEEEEEEEEEETEERVAREGPGGIEGGEDWERDRGVGLNAAPFAVFVKSV